MTKNETTLRKQRGVTFSLSAIVAGVTAFLATFGLFYKLSKAYSFLLECEVTPEDAVRTFYAQLSAVAFLLPVDYGSGWRACFLLIFCLAVNSVWDCLNAGNDKD